MATVVHAPDSYSQEGNILIFLAGAIDMGAAEDWQSHVASVLNDLDVLLLNPRRLAWDSSWEQSIDNPPFREQVNWELDALDVASHIIMMLPAESKAPISLLELGLYARSGRLIVACEQGFWRRGNVEVVCHRHNIPVFDNLDALLLELRKRILP